MGGMKGVEFFRARKKKENTVTNEPGLESKEGRPQSQEKKEEKNRACGRGEKKGECLI